MRIRLSPIADCRLFSTADGLAYHVAQPRVRFILPGGLEESSEFKPLDEERPLRAPRQWFKWTEADDAQSLVPKIERAATAISECAAAALANAPDAKLVLGGFSQGAAVTLNAACRSGSKMPKPMALVQLAAQAPPSELPANSLEGVKLLVAAGSSDPIAPVATATKLYDACGAAGASALPMHTFDGEHEVTLDTVHKVGQLLNSLLGSDETVAIN